MSDEIFDSKEFLEGLRSLDNEAWQLLLREGQKRLSGHYRALGLSHQAQDLWSTTICRLLKGRFLDHNPERSGVMTFVVSPITYHTKG